MSLCMAMEWDLGPYRIWKDCIVSLKMLILYSVTQHKGKYGKNLFKQVYDLDIIKWTVNLFTVAVIG